MKKRLFLFSMLLIFSLSFVSAIECNDGIDND